MTKEEEDQWLSDIIKSCGDVLIAACGNSPEKLQELSDWIDGMDAVGRAAKAQAKAELALSGR